METQLAENEKALEILKQQGPLSISSIAGLMKVTVEGARFHLLKLEKEGFVTSTSKAEGRGRPKQIWSLTQKGHDRFPDAHAELTANLINMMRDALGEDAVDKVIDRHQNSVRSRYLKEMDSSDNLEERLKKLAGLRSREGYMAEYKKEDDSFLFIENHCPICSAAKACQGFCKAEKNVFESVLGADVTVERVEHIIKGARRCCYRITKS